MAKIAKSAVRGVLGPERHFGDDAAFDSQLPENAKLQKETALSLVKRSTVFINYLGAWND